MWGVSVPGPPGPAGPPGNPGPSSGVSAVTAFVCGCIVHRFMYLVKYGLHFLGIQNAEHSASLFPQVTVLRSYDTMIATARRQEEGSLVYILDRADLYLRVRDGLRQVMVESSTS